MTSSGVPDAASLLERAKAARDDLAARMLLAAAVTQAGLKVGARIIVTGGTAVDFYVSKALGTSAAYPTKWRPSGDVDVVVLSVGGWGGTVRIPLLKELETLGMRPSYVGESARVVEIPDLGYTLELVGNEINHDPKAERVLTVLVDDKYPVTLRGPEDVILAYAESGWDTRHGGDWERALAVYAAMEDRLDLPLLFDEAARRGVKAVVDRVVRQEPLRRGGSS